MRSMRQFHYSHFESSINFPVDKCDDQFFINWDPQSVLNNWIKNAGKRALFEGRRRSFVFIIASSNDITHFLDKLPKIIDPTALSNYTDKYSEDTDKIENILSIRNALLLYRALKNERIREL